jgi:predicted RNA-binding Zn-ribbon protein involved in translation (DUF1610 family)
MSNHDNWLHILDEFQKITGVDSEHATRSTIEEYHCPRCGALMLLREAPLKDGSGLAYRTGCGLRGHFRSQWHRTTEGVLRELVQRFETEETK